MHADAHESLPHLGQDLRSRPGLCRRNAASVPRERLTAMSLALVTSSASPSAVRISSAERARSGVEVTDGRAAPAIYDLPCSIPLERSLR
jgi:hypothetical protein